MKRNAGMIEVIYIDFRLAVENDLPQIKSIYKGIIEKMNDNQIEIWDDVYPCEFFQEDIKKNRLYLLLDHDVIVSAFSLCDTSEGADFIKWESDTGKALYLDRLGVNIHYSRRGIGSFMLSKAKETAKNLGAEYLRLFVVDINIPAIQLYQNNGFTRASSIYNQIINRDLVLHEFGYEIKLL